MATMLLAAAGSVGGTVAWFSAQTTFDTEVSSFKVVRLDGDLACTMGAGTGTSVTDNVVSVAANAELTHGSFDHTSGNVYTKVGASYSSRGVVSGTDGTVSGSTQLVAGTYTVSSTTHTVYHAVTWTMDFKYQLPVSASSAGNTNLYFDVARSAVTLLSTDTTPTGATKETSKGFRIAFFPQSGAGTSGSNLTTTLVWADLQTSANCKYVKLVGETPTGATAYTSGELLDSAATAGAVYTDASGSTSANNYLGQFKTFSEGASHISFTCVAWFEGEDTNVENLSKFQTVKAGLYFFTLPNA